MSDEFQELKEKFADVFIGEGVLELRFFLSDYIPISGLAVDEYAPSVLLNKLTAKAGEAALVAIISPTKVKLMWEIAEIIKNVKAQNYVLEYYVNEGIEKLDGFGIKAYRKILYQAIKEIDSTDFRRIRNFYELDTLSDIKTTWDVVFYLQKNDRLSTKKHLQSFAKRFKGKANRIITDGLSKMQKKENDNLKELYFEKDEEEGAARFQKALKKFKEEKQKKQGGEGGGGDEQQTQGGTGSGGGEEKQKKQGGEGGGGGDEQQPQGGTGSGGGDEQQTQGDVGGGGGDQPEEDIVDGNITSSTPMQPDV